ncbi:hypothetical protein [Flavobacterium wongokense]|uniref:hypothetical protein n=1 Tax=Flavobacterium wongokense TaxID=2910674 RepID=UPI001F2D0F74|nr:hypothetical protein [Flavobacterium sp. WG47]MCF6133535.1 hypothetical protein [Flavobacterium sp. WG47]
MLNFKLKDPDSITITYMTMRKIIGFLAFLLVPTLVLGAFITDHSFVIRGSVSAYYYSGMRNALVGVICGISLFLVSYHGYTAKDSIASKFAGIFALGIAFFPTSEREVKNDIISIIHYITAGLFFCTLSYMSIKLFTMSKGYKTVKKRKRNKIYIACGITMLVAAACIPISSIKAIHIVIRDYRPTLICETIALVSFGISWLTKGGFIFKDKD